MQLVGFVIEIEIEIEVSAPLLSAVSAHAL
jgi:hypothetical protein